MNRHAEEPVAHDTAPHGTPAAEIAPPEPLWYKDAVVYQLHVRAFFDSNDDGHGDFRGLTSKLDYIKELGVNTIWLLPFYPSPLRDDGYDVADYHDIHPQYGTRHDFRTFMREARRRDLRVITELVVNHTSDQHPWFQAARRAPPGSSKRDFYVWSDDERKYAGTRIIFTDTETSNWTFDPVAKAYFWHRFFSHQPDLNFDNPHVLKAVFRAMRFWLDMGVDGFRLDAIPYLVEREGTSNENLPETHAVIRQLRALVDAHYPNRVLLAEANQWPEDVSEYFGNGDECMMAYHFPLMPRMYMAIAQEDRTPIVEIMQQTPEIPANCQWAIFLRNHDELTLEMVTSRERDYMYRMYAADAQARINLGIRRRLAPLMDNDLERIKLMNSLLLSMPGSPIIYYGDEIGMGDNVFLGDRNGVRTPMQWSPDRNAGFSRSDPQRLYLPPVADPVYGFQAVNVEAQQRDPASLLNWMKRMLATRRSSSAFGRGRLSFLKPGNRKVLAYLRELEDDTILCVANLARSAQPVELDLRRFRGRVPVELHGRTPFPPIGDLPYLLTLPGYGFYWFRLAVEASVPAWHEAALAPEELPVLVMFDGWSSFFRDRVVPWRITMAVRLRDQFEQDTMPKFMAKQRWFSGKGDATTRARLAQHLLWETSGRAWLLAAFDVEPQPGAGSYFVPLALAWEDDEARTKALAGAAIAKVRQQARVGTLADAMADEAFCREIVAAIGAAREVRGAQGKLRFVPASTFADIAGADPAALDVRRARGSSSNTVVSFGERLFLKLFRRMRAGINPEVEVGRYLTEVARFPHCVPVAGTVEYTEAGGASFTLAVLQGYVANQGDAWSYATEYLERFLDRQRTQSEPPAPDAHGGFMALMHTLGVRTAELHLAFARRTGDPAFDPERFEQADLDAWKARLRSELAQTLQAIDNHRREMTVPARMQVETLLASRKSLLARIDRARPPAGGTLKTRYHGDFHLGQVLLAKHDFVIIDFEGEPGRTLEERRAKRWPLCDVAGMLRSFDYARWSAIRSIARDDEDARRLEPLAAGWLDETLRTYLAAYADATKDSGLFASFDETRDLLGLAELEKALYELRYELGNRPNWVAVPLTGLLALAQGARGPADDATDARGGAHG